MKIRLRGKFLAGFICLIVMVSGISLSSFVSLNKLKDIISKISYVSNENITFEMIKSDFSNLTLNTNLYSQTGEDKYFEDVTTYNNGVNKKLEGMIALEKDPEHIGALKKMSTEQENLSVLIQDIYALTEDRNKVLEKKLHTIGSNTAKKVSKISDNAFYSGNPDAALTAAQMKSYFLEARISTQYVLLGRDIKNKSREFSTSLSSYRESGDLLIAYLKDKKQKEEVRALMDDKGYEAVLADIVKNIGQVQEKLAAIQESESTISGLVAGLSADLEVKRDEAFRTSVDTVSWFKWLVSIVLVLGGSAVLILVTYLMKTLSATVRNLFEGFDRLKIGVKETDVTTSEMVENLTSVVTSAKEVSERGEVMETSVSTMSGSITTVSSAVEELDRSIREIQNITANSLMSSQSAVERTVRMEEVINELSKASEQIGEVVVLINSLAEQTNLLALNATIEAARAGEAGKGFSVVADEVKKLAVETTHSTDSIRQQVSRISDISSQALSYMNELADCVRDIEVNSQHIDNAVNEQQAGTSSIGDAMNDVTKLSRNVSEAIAEISERMDKMRDISATVSNKSNTVKQSILLLSKETENFRSHLKKV